MNGRSYLKWLHHHHGPSYACLLYTSSPEGKKQFEVQCPMGAPESNMNWQDIKDALDEQDFEAFWVVEREGFYDEHDKCIADDARWIKENIR